MILLAYSPFLIEWTETASVIVSTKPEDSPVMSIRKLTKKSFKLKCLNKMVLSHPQPDPAIALLLLEDPTEPLNQLRGELFLPQIGSSLLNHRDHLVKLISLYPFVKQPLQQVKHQQVKQHSHPNWRDDPKAKQPLSDSS